ncbi:acetyl-CoA carboxylase carboxyltransferase subunit alpha [Tuwongella immobilis]|uniref:Acetyl-coenzyme A carboxylase carboxyl transferase subunit alpha n=1 Tax=Tuwongella immobilis TaxID=692036 RepID=A0A6C2YPQ5_9BACT|nr:acetyl-CoA carboxylase carboxyltransferase subunit alpha [Tuwongella immobilis]VIP03113.1 acetyl- carboxylase subunit alpha : Acetyl-coenzyme A carboxylase carboxyl transferase subunit alpha OS=Blastopirellula marina DSM 3645 GN=accA PE=3 SV=1: ACCA [Tuwongella immobilis]VTS03427.1 acetyl- carboxylase subunit alpha : Acetyl-coenzyme A carboxylase carboxyl transferase subunit alpha OS=Blastopirellula marina DSM 3645 GN=accA PE=3 SV=1: ACCA [Tuwongella immobilis]
MAPPTPLAFESEIHQLEELLSKLEQESKGVNPTEEIRQIRKELTNLKKNKYANLDPWETVLVSRHPQRPQTMDYVDLMFDDFVELHGDRAFGDDRAIRCGFARLGDHRVMLIGHQKGHTLQERQACFYGCAHPEGYRKALNKMRLAAKFKIPIICFIDTPGAFPGIGAEERGQAQLIATSLLEMSKLTTPVVCVVIGEGGSGGALGIGIGDRVSMLKHAYYSVISPEGCAGILWKKATEETKSRAASALRMTSSYLEKLKIIDDVIPEPLGGAHRDHNEMANTLKTYLLRYLRELKGLSTDVLMEQRYLKFRKMGVYLDPLAASGS